MPNIRNVADASVACIALMGAHQREHAIRLIASVLELLCTHYACLHNCYHLLVTLTHDSV